MAPNGQKITCIIVDDNPIARESLMMLAQQIDDLEVLNDCENAFEAYNYLQNNEVDLILLDIEMPEMTGIELTRNLNGKKNLIIFTTSNKDYAIEAFDLNVADYLVKPFSSQRFLQAIDKARDILCSKTEEVELANDEFIFVRDGNIVRRLRIDDILYAEAMGDYVKFHTSDKLFAIHTRLKSVEERLPKNKFIRIHRSYIVSLQHISTLQEGGMVINGCFLPIADSYRKNLYRMMNII
ncbi:LytR/AlgR family response regulator transcription factor [Pedobacter rhizosphaerae]|uniref:Two component transcriptional regulator, LytTR family n=1 Tax=Pedobacter rhizosphaerae TaxID=390241 RepID=A0A1H9VE52_9SPHI|nr:LytTR family DNA-binding domain-containing protein [Pedobacter rhizosphaerae]SES19517.1 two component transcriptional regulator, LytTR family [Pedobacter rhizosphaerae]